MRLMKALLVAFIPLVAAIDLFAWRYGGVETTFSRILYRWNQDYWWLSYVIVFGLGMLVDHLFAPPFTRMSR